MYNGTEHVEHIQHVHVWSHSQNTLNNTWFELVFESTFELVEVNFGASETFKPNELSLVRDGF